MLKFFFGSVHLSLKVPLLMITFAKVSVGGTLSTRRSEETTTSRRIPSPSSQPAHLRPGYSGTASSSRRPSKPTSRSSRLPTPPPTTTGTSPATASRTSTGSTSTPGRSRRRTRERMEGIEHCGSTVIGLQNVQKLRCTPCTLQARAL